LAVEYPRGLDHRGATRLLERAVERTVRELIGKAYPHAVDFAPHDNGIDGLSAIMDFAARARRQARPVDPRSPFGKVADPRLDAVEHPVDDDVEVERCALVMARCAEKGAGHGSVLPRHGKFRVTMKRGRRTARAAGARPPHRAPKARAPFARAKALPLCRTRLPPLAAPRWIAFATAPVAARPPWQALPQIPFGRALASSPGFFPLRNLAAMGAAMTDLHLHPSLREAALTSKAWPFEEARKLVKRYPEGKPGGQA